MRVTFVPESDGLQLYVRFDPTVNGNGGGGPGNGGADSATVAGSPDHPILVASDPVTATNAANRDYAQPVFAALDGTFTAASTGFAGSESDGIVQLDASHGLATDVPRRTGRERRRRPPRSALDDEGSAVLALGFGATQDEAVARRTARSARASTRPSPPTRRAGRPTTPG